jgi:hypothetical protein
MERRLNQRIEEYLIEFKHQIAGRIQTIVQGIDETDAAGIGNTSIMNDVKSKCNSLAAFVYNYEKIKVGKDDFMKRKRVKSVVPIYDRCCAKRASGEQCTRRKKEGETYCGTHIKGTPHSVMEENIAEPSTPKNVKVDIWAQDIKGIIYYIDKMGNVYDTEDIMKIDKYPKRIIAKYVQDPKGGYSIPSIFGGGGGGGGVGRGALAQ